MMVEDNGHPNSPHSRQLCYLTQPINIGSVIFALNYSWVLFHGWTKVLVAPEATLSTNSCPVFPWSVTWAGGPASLSPWMSLGNRTDISAGRSLWLVSLWETQQILFKPPKLDSIQHWKTTDNEFLEIPAMDDLWNSPSCLIVQFRSLRLRLKQHSTLKAIGAWKPWKNKKHFLSVLKLHLLSPSPHTHFPSPPFSRRVCPRLFSECCV